LLNERSRGDLNFNLLDEQESKNQPSFGAKLGYLATVIVSIGDILATVATRIIIEEDLATAKKEDMEKTDNDKKLEKMQNQIDELQTEIKRLMKANNR
jgi:hypothetical protein